MCDNALQKIEEAFLQFGTVQEEACEDQLRVFPQSMSASSASTIDHLLPESNGGNVDDIELDTSGNGTLLDAEPCFGHQQLNPTVEAMLRNAVESIDAFALQKPHVHPSLNLPNVKHSRGRIIRRPSFDNEAMTVAWLGCKAAERKRYERLSSTSWRTFNRMLHQTQQSLKFFNIGRRIYNVVH